MEYHPDLQKVGDFSMGSNIGSVLAVLLASPLLSARRYQVQLLICISFTLTTCLNSEPCRSHMCGQLLSLPKL